jgi:hypothetical protein
VRLSQTLAIIALLIGFSSCGTGSDSDTKDVSQDQLLASDLADLGSYKSAGAIQYDQQNNGIFTQIFGGTTSADLTNYLNTRVHYYIDKDQDVSISPADFQNMGWTQETLLKTLADTNNDATVCAVNVSIEYWILGLLNNTLVTFNFNDQNVPLTSARTGIVVLGDGYSDTIAIKDGQGNSNTVSLPAFYRQSILLHEARHSDCTGGLSDFQLSRISQETSAAEFSANDDAGTCGHLHIMCPSGDYQGLYACDDEIYGAYGVQDVFLDAAELQLQIDNPDSVEDHLAIMMEVDTKSRLLDDGRGAEYPDMSSTDSVSQ